MVIDNTFKIDLQEKTDMKIYIHSTAYEKNEAR